MSRISDGLREWIDDEDLYATQIAELGRIAGRIDSEMVELPVGADGKPIHVGDAVYGEDGMAWHVRGVTIGEKSTAHPGHVIRATNDAEQLRCLRPEWLTHERPDSLARIADDMRAEIEPLEHGSFASDDALDALRDYEARIRALAGKEDTR